MRRLGQRLDVEAAASPSDGGGQVAGALCARGQRAEQPGQLGGVLAARAQRPVAVEAVEQLTLPRVRVDQYLNVAWKVLLPLSILNFVATAVMIKAGWI